MAAPVPLLRFNSIRIQGYRPFNDFSASFEPLQIIVGANGVGKSALFEMLRFLSSSMQNQIPPEIIAGSSGQQTFHLPGEERIEWSLDVGRFQRFRYSGRIEGPIGKVRVQWEHVDDVLTSAELLDVVGGDGWIAGDPPIKITTDRPDQLALSTITERDSEALATLKRQIYITGVYDAGKIKKEVIRRAVPVQQTLYLSEDFSNLSAALFHLMTEHHDQFLALQEILALTVGDFKSLTVKARGGPGEVIAFLKQRDNVEISLADISDGTLRLLCWAALCHSPNIHVACVDEPDAGLHPRALPLLADMFRKASAKRQFLISTHSSYFLRQFELSEIAVIRKENGEPKWVKPADSKILKESLEDFGEAEIERMHRSEELEQLA